jgi:ABC-2 type transport system permease protein
VSWRRLRTLLRREVRATLRDPFTLGAMIAVPLAALLAFSFVLSVNVKHLSLGTFDGSQSPASRALLADLGSGDAFDTHPYPNADALRRALVGGEISVAVVIPADFERRLEDLPTGGDPPEVQAIYDGAETVLAGNAEAYLEGIVQATGARLVARSAGGAAAAGGSPGVAVRARALFNPRLDGTPFMVAGTFGFVLSFLTTIITAVSIVNERLSGTYDQLQLTPATNLEILLGKLLPLGGVFALDVAIMMGVAWALLGVWPRGSALFFLLVASVYVMTSLAMGLFFSATSATAAEAVQKTVLVSIPLVQLSGFIFPIRNMPRAVQWLAECLPATHFIRVTRAIYLRAAGPVELWPEVLIIVFFGVALAALALRSLARRV